jgi:two-component system, OmpR family, response regulator
LRILLVEDDPVIAKGLGISLGLEGISVQAVATLSSANQALASQTFDLVLLDLNLPDGHGLTLAKQARESHPELPVVMLTASGDEESVVAGFAAGAVDYVRKPFSNKELLARIRVALGAKSRVATKALHFGGVVVHRDKRLVECGELRVELNRREFDIFCHFMSHPEAVVTRESLLSVLEHGEEIFDRTIDSHISHLRSRLRKAGIDSVRISPVYGVGYRLEKQAK